MKMNYPTFFVIIILLFILAADIVNAGLGQSAGALIFGNVSRGGKETLSYGVINPNDQTIQISAELLDNIEKIASVEPKTATIPPHSYIPVYVTVHMPRDAKVGEEYKGQVLVKQTEGGKSSGFGIGFNVAVIKSIVAVAGEEIAPPEKPEPPKPKEPPYFLIFILSIMGLVILFIYRVGWLRSKK